MDPPAKAPNKEVKARRLCSSRSSMRPRYVSLPARTMPNSTSGLNFIYYKDNE